MGQNSGFHVEKLSNAIEELGLDRRAYNVLKRSGVHIVLDIIVLGETRISNLKNMGPATTDQVFTAMTNYLNITREQLFDKEIKRTVLSDQEKQRDPMAASVTVLDLPYSTIRTLQALNVFSINDLLKLRAESNNSNGIGSLHKNESKKTYKKLISYLNDIGGSGENNIDTAKSLTKRPVIDLNIIFELLFTMDRTLRIIDLRVFQLLTLEEIAGEAGGVTRERIRQIIDLVLERIRENFYSLSIYCDYFEGKARRIQKKLENKPFIKSTLIEHLKGQLSGSGLIATDEELEILIAILRLLVIHDKPWSREIVRKRWKTLILLACLVDPSIIKHEKVNRLVQRNKAKTKKASYKELALLVLLDAQEPLHWSKIADRAYHIGNRDSFNATALYNTLMSHPSIFVRIDAGTYALVEWGYSQAEYYPDIIASILRSENKPISLETIYIRVCQIRNIRRSTLTMLLSMHPRFYKSKENAYGLRVWLQPREKQTLRTPEWQVESSDSYKRLEQASQRGYDIDSMISLDLHH